MPQTHTSGVEIGRGQPYMLDKAIGAIKDGVPVEDYAATVTELHKRSSGHGGALRGSCPVHGGSNPSSFVVFPEEGRFKCFSCQDHGDVIDLARAVEGGELWEAVVSLAMRYGVELPQRPESWHRRQGEKHEVRKRVINALARSYQRRLYRIYAPVLDGIADPGEHRREAEALYRNLYPVALYCAKARAER